MRKPEGTCADCGRPVWRATGSLPQGTSRCRPCRVARPDRFELSCQACGVTFAAGTPTAKACSNQCRRNLRDGLRCADCNQPMAKTPGSYPQGVARCQPCRRLSQPPPRVCVDCGVACTGDRCRACFAKHQTIRSDDDHRVARSKREQAAPGLRPCERAALKAKWKRQGRACAYCPKPADTIDHVVPLVRGGTNYEGNLAPCCKSCNSSKAARTIIEWRTGRRLPRMTQPLAWTGKPARIKPIKAEPIELFRVCVCGAVYTGRGGYCSPRCSARSAYRLKVGIPLDVKPYAVRVA